MTTSSDIQAQIAALEAQVVALQAQQEAIADLAIMQSAPDQSGAAAVFTALAGQVGDTGRQTALQAVAAKIGDALNDFGVILTTTTQAAEAA
jgi:hypothetical protein